MSPQLVNPSALSKRSMGKEIGLFIITFGFYGLYWMHQVNVMMAEATDENFDPTMRTVLLIIPLVNIYGLWQFCNTAEAVTDQDATILFVVWLFVAPLSWYWVNSGINKHAQ